jgi:hypothetical protein
MFSAVVRTPATVGLKITWKLQELELASVPLQLLFEIVKSPAVAGTLMPVTVDPELFVTDTL